MKYNEKLMETLTMIEEAEEFGDVVLATEWVAGLRERLRKFGYKLLFWRGLNDNIYRDWVTITKYHRWTRPAVGEAVTTG